MGNRGVKYQNIENARVSGNSNARCFGCESALVSGFFAQHDKTLSVQVRRLKSHRIDRGSSTSHAARAPLRMTGTIFTLNDRGQFVSPILRISKWEG